MRTWRAAVAVLPLLASFAGKAQTEGVQQQSAGHSAGANFNLPAIPQYVSQSPFKDGMIDQEEIAPNAHLGVGLAPMLGRNIRSVRIEHDPIPTRNPGVTLVVRFPG